MDASSGTKATLAAAAVPLLGAAAVLMMIGGGANAEPSSNVCGAGGTAARIGTIALDAEQMGNAHTIVTVAAGRHLPVYAADIAVDTAYTESGLHNSTAETDHDSQGLFQQRMSIYTAAVAADPVKATNAFLDRLIAIPNWQHAPVGVAAQSVQRSQYPDRYQPNAALAAQLVGQFWPAAAAAAEPALTVPTSTGSTATASTLGTGATICPGGGGALATGGAIAGRITGPNGDNVAGTTTIPTGLSLSGTAKGNTAVRFALAQLGKPYVFGAAGPDAYDCSGLTMAAWAEAGVALPHLAAAQTSAGIPEPTDLSRAVSGDLVMIPGSDGTAANPGHVGMVAGYVDQHDGRHLYVIQAPMTGIPVELTQATEWSGQIVAVRHIA
jgi:cell wall-associated NlpC family hydrolase